MISGADAGTVVASGYWQPGRRAANQAFYTQRRPLPTAPRAASIDVHAHRLEQPVMGFDQLGTEDVGYVPVQLSGDAWIEA